MVLMSFSASICVRPAVTNCPYHTTGSARTAVGRFLLLAQLSGTHCAKTFGIRSVVLTVTDSRWRHFYFRSTSVFSALEVFLRECAIQIYVWHWHLTFSYLVYFISFKSHEHCNLPCLLVCDAAFNIDRLCENWVRVVPGLFLNVDTTLWAGQHDRTLKQHCRQAIDNTKLSNTLTHDLSKSNHFTFDLKHINNQNLVKFRPLVFTISC